MDNVRFQAMFPWSHSRHFGQYTVDRYTVCIVLRLSYINDLWSRNASIWFENMKWSKTLRVSFWWTIPSDYGQRLFVFWMVYQSQNALQCTNSIHFVLTQTVYTLSIPIDNRRTYPIMCVEYPFALNSSERIETCRVRATGYSMANMRFWRPRFEGLRPLRNAARDGLHSLKA